MDKALLTEAYKGGFGMIPMEIRRIAVLVFVGGDDGKKAIVLLLGGMAARKVVVLLLVVMVLTKDLMCCSW